MYQQAIVGSRPNKVTDFQPRGDSNLFTRMCLKNIFFVLGQLFTVDTIDRLLFWTVV